jgi:hypothetical protein
VIPSPISPSLKTYLLRLREKPLAGAEVGVTQGRSMHPAVWRSSYRRQRIKVGTKPFLINPKSREKSVHITA